MNVDSFNFESPLIRSWLAYALNVPENSFVSIEDYAELLHMPLIESNAISDFFVERPYNPHHLPSETVVWSVHATTTGGVDLFRATYEKTGLWLTLYQANTFVLLHVQPKDVEASFELGRRRYVARLLDRERLICLSMGSHEWVVKLPPELDDMSRSFMIANEGAPSLAPPLIGIHDHDDRIDVLVSGHETAFLFYKKIGQRPFFEPTDTWFSDEARAAVRAAQAAQEVHSR